MKAYINSSKAITPQNSFQQAFPWETITDPAIHMSANEPAYKEFLPPLKLRRMSRIVKMGLCSALECLKSVNIEMPGGIITATGWGCLADTHKFLNEIGELKEETLSPATFIQSTHNTVSGQIALMLQCQEYTSVNVHGSSSFEHSLLDALLLIEEGKDNILVGGVDEIIEADLELKRKVGYWKKENDSLELTKSTTPGTIAGEGAAFFLLVSKPEENTYSYVADTCITITENPAEIVNKLLKNNNLNPGDIDLVLSGINGDCNQNLAYKKFLEENFNSTSAAYYKHLSGEYDTASAFSLFLADNIIKTQQIPDYMLLQNSEKKSEEINHILIHHFSNPQEHAFILVSRTGI